MLLHDVWSQIFETVSRLGHAATPCPKLVADVSFIMPLAIMPPGHNGIVYVTWVLTPHVWAHTRLGTEKNNPKRWSCMPHWSFETLCSACGDTCQRSEHCPVKISTFRPLLIRRPLRRPSPLIAMRSDFDEWMNHPFWLLRAAAWRAGPLSMLYGSRDEITMKTWISIVVWETLKNSFWECRKDKVITSESDPSDYEGGNSKKNHNVSFKRIILYIFFSHSAENATKGATRKPKSM